MVDNGRTGRLENRRALSVARKVKKRLIPRPARTGIQRRCWQLLRKKSGHKRRPGRMPTTLRQKMVDMEEELAHFRTRVHSLSCKVDDISARLEANNAWIAAADARMEALISQRIEERLSSLKNWVAEKLGVPPPAF